jgi:hypothetical protein
VIDALQALFNVDDKSPNISQDIVEVVRSITSTSGCEAAMATSQTISMLRRAAEICRGDMKTVYSIAVILYR